MFCNVALRRCHVPFSSFLRASDRTQACATFLKKCSVASASFNNRALLWLLLLASLIAVSPLLLSPAMGAETKPATAAAPLVAAPATPVPPSAKPTPPPPVLVRTRTTLPDEHQYQQELRKYLASLTAKDFEHGVTEPFSTPPGSLDPEDQYRHWILGRMLQPLVGSKRGMPFVNAPAKLFTLSEIETPTAVLRPPMWPEPAAFLVRWNYPGNPYYNSRAMKLRAFVSMCVHMMMGDDLIEHAPEIGANRTDKLTPALILMAHPYPAVRDVVPEGARQAYEIGLRKMTQRVLDWGPVEEDPQLDSIAPVALWLAGQALNDPKLNAEIEAFGRYVYADKSRFNPAGYFVDRGGIDLGYAGQTNFFMTWAALATHWPFAKEAVEKTHRLRAHLCLPEPDGRYFGPSHFQTRYSADAWKDQWEWGDYRDTAASFVTDEAIYLTKYPTAEELANAAPRRAQFLQGNIKENPLSGTRKGYLLNEEIANHPWSFRPWQTYNFPGMVSYAYEHYPRGAYAHRDKLEKEKSPLLRSPFMRDENFVREFGDAFTVIKRPSYSAIVHSGHIGEADENRGYSLYPGPYGFGGGQLSAFWTPATGSVILGRRGGMTREKNFDLLDDWRLWPVHAVSGMKVDGKIFSTARIPQPELKRELQKESGIVRVSAAIPKGMLGQPKVLEGRVQFGRTFELSADAVRVETKLQSSGQDTLKELYETIPVFLRDAAQQAKATPTIIEFLTGNNWIPATAEWNDKVTAVRLSRFEGVVQITFDQPRRLKLSANDWADTYLSRANCRNILIDLLESKDEPKVLHNVTVGYRIAAVKK